MTLALLLDNGYNNGDTFIQYLGRGFLINNTPEERESEILCVWEWNCAKSICINSGIMSKFRLRPSAKFCGFGRKAIRTDEFRIEQIMKSVDNWYSHCRKNEVISLR